MLTAEAVDVVADEEAILRAAQMSAAGSKGRRKAEWNMREKAIIRLRGQTDCVGECALCGKRWTGSALAVIAAQVEHREKAHGITNPKKKPRSREEHMKQLEEARKRKRSKAVSREEAQARVIDALRTHGVIKNRVEVARLAGLSRGATYGALTELRKRGKIVVNPKVGEWRFPDQ